ncbi:MAG TPA: SRPBCC family protein [Sphingopyxis sp.]|nr:SRPBCC family protein [Sphingopyxis sp.]
MQSPLLPEAPTAARYALTASLFILLQHVFVALAVLGSGARPKIDNAFLLFPIRELAMQSDVSPLVVIAGFAVALLISTLLVILSLRRAAFLGRGGGLALVAMVPTLQILAVLALTVLWRRPATPEPATAPETGSDAIAPRQTAIGVLAGMALIILAVAVSTVTFGSYGWGLFVMTPLLVGVTTGYIINRGKRRSVGETFLGVVAAGTLGTAALLMLALEGFMCIVLIAPLAIVLAGIGGEIGRAAARQWHPHQPFYSIAVLPLIFALEAAMPPELPIVTRGSIVIAAPPDAVWRSLTADRPVTEAPGLVGMAGLAYPVASRIDGEGLGAHRVGIFSTGPADERITIWRPGRTLAFRVVHQPPAMEEMSPYRNLDTPHLIGYFDTGETRFDLVPLADGRTRLIATADHVLRIDPVLYWGPIASWAIGRNVKRVLTDVRNDAERGAEMARQRAPVSAQSPHGHPIA